MTWGYLLDILDGMYLDRFSTSPDSRTCSQRNADIRRSIGLFEVMLLDSENQETHFRVVRGNLDTLVGYGYLLGRLEDTSNASA